MKIYNRYIKFLKNDISSFFGYSWVQVLLEIVKFTGIYKAIEEMFRVEFLAILDKIKSHANNIKGARYDEYFFIFDYEVQKKFGDLNLFNIGAGVGQLELLKNFTMIGENNQSL